MDIVLANIDLILTSAVIIIAAIVFARKGQIELLKELIAGLAENIDTDILYSKLPRLTRLLLSDKTVHKIALATQNPVESTKSQSN